MVVPGKEGRISSCLGEALTGRRAGAVHSCFNTSFNFTLGEQLIHAGPESRPLCAFGMELPPGQAEMILKSAAPGDLVSCLDGRITLYGRNEIFTLHGDRMEPVDLRIEPGGPCEEGALWGLLRELKLAGQLGIEADGRFRACCRGLEAFARGSFLPPLPEAVSWLIGRGRGLTPSGDDILLGYGSGLLALDPSGAGRRFLDLLSGCLHGQTTDISLGYYKALAAGCVNENMKFLLRGFWSNDRADTARWLKSVGAVGHTSGCDTLFGLRLASTIKMKDGEVNV